MAMVLSAFVELFVEHLAELAKDEIIRILGVEDDLVQLLNTLDIIKVFLIDAESKKISEKSISLWLADIRNLMYDADDLLDDCRVEAEKNQSTSKATSSSQPQSPSAFKRRYRYVPTFLSCFGSVPFRHEIGKRIQGINNELNKLWLQIPRLNLVKILSDSNPTPHNSKVGQSSSSQTEPVIVVSEIVGIDEDAKHLVDLLTGSVSRKCKCPVYAITGMPGIGKSTLATKVFNDSRIVTHFTVVMWVSVSKTYVEVDLLKEIVRSITKENRDNEGRRENYADATKVELCSKIRKHVEHMRFFLVLDDVWDEKVWEDLLRAPLHDASNDSRVLITTRKEDAARGMGATYCHKVKKMLDKEGWFMLCKVVFRDEEEEVMEKYKEIGMEIVQKCKGLPLAIKAVAGVLKKKDRTVKAWKRICSSQTWELAGLPENIKPGLLLSYYDLSSHLKQCFIYCSLFPEDFTFHRPTLVQMWIAEGFVKEDMAAQLSMEDKGDEYYNELVMRNLLQEVPDYFDRLGCKMHDLVRSLALYVSQSEYMYKDSHFLGCNSMNPRHLSFMKKDVKDMVPIMDKKHESLRTLLLSRNPSIKKIPSELFDMLTRLRVLDASYTGVRSLPESLGNLIHLRFLGVSFTKIKSLPDSIKNLKNLETLKANGSKYLRRLPKGVNQLEKLRHLEVGGADTQLDCMPLGIEKLKKLRTLKGFVANDSTLCEESNLKELQNLLDLTDLSVYKLENIASTTELEEARLDEKTRLRYLRLSCSCKIKSHQHEGGDIKRIEEVFERINPPQSLEAFHLEGFFGYILPSFITKCSLSNLTWLRFQDCRLVKVLPPVGMLPELTVLQIWGATSVSKIGSEFFDGANGFPKLQELHLLAMPKLESISNLEQGAMRCLKKLHIEKCPKLKSLPSGLNHVKNLTQLVIEGCQNIKAIGNLNSVTLLELKNNSKLRIISNLPALNIMNISNCSSLRDVINANNLSYLVLLDDNMEALPQWLENTTLKKLDVQGNTHLISSMCNGGAGWPIIKKILRVEAKSHDGLSYISYRKENPFIFQSNLTDNVDASSTSVTLNASNDNTEDEEC